MFILNFEKLRKYVFEIIVNKSFVILVSVEGWHFLPTNWASATVIQVFTHALNAESMSARKYAALNHKVGADNAVGYLILVFFKIVFVQLLFDLGDAFVDFSLFDKDIRASFHFNSLFFIILDFSKLFKLHGKWKTLLIEGDNFNFRPIS